MTRFKISDLIDQNKKSKYRAKRVKIDGYNFDSMKEAKRYQELLLLQKAGDIQFFIRQPSFDLGAGTVYRSDFLVIWKDGSYTIEDVKGVQTPIFKLKKKLIESKFPISIKII